MARSEANDVEHVLGLAHISPLVDEIKPDLSTTHEFTNKAGRPARALTECDWATRKSWSQSRRVIAKAEATPTHGL